MKLASQHIDALRSVIVSAEACAVNLVGAEIFPGPTRFSPPSSVVCYFDAVPDDFVIAAAEEASRLLSSRLGIQTRWGIHDDHQTESLCWVEYFPGGANYDSALFAFHALRTAFIFAAVGESQNALKLRAAQQAKKRFYELRAPEVDVQSRFLVSAARGANIPVNNIAGSAIAWQFGWGSRSDIFHKTASTVFPVSTYGPDLRL